MALAKLWNAVFGKRKEVEGGQPPATTLAASAPAPAGRTVSSPSAQAAKAIAAPPPGVKLSRKKTKVREPKKPVIETVAPVEEPAPVLRMFRRKNNAWSKLIGARSVSSILDTRVGDGSRAVELLEAIVDSNTPAPRYVAIGLFELGGEKLTVRQFHQKVRAVGGNPIVIPMQLEDGLRRVSQTIGQVDLILVDGTDARVNEPAVAKWLQRVTASNGLVLRSDAAGKWHSTPTAGRKAA
jgi:hypothetical protein